MDGVRTSLLGVPTVMAHRTVIDLFGTVFVLTAYAVNFWSSRLSGDKKRFEWEGSGVSMSTGMIPCS